MPHRNAVDPSAVAAHSGDAHEYTYRIIAQAPPLASRELESTSSAIEIVIVWGGVSVLCAEHLSPPRSFSIGEGPGTDFVIGAETLGCERLPLVLHADGGSRVVVPRDASAEMEREGEPLSLEAQPISDYAGARSFPLVDGITIRVQLGDFMFIVRAVAAARRVGAAAIAQPAWGRSRWTFASAAIHLAVLGLCYFLPPSSSALSMDRLDTESRLVKYAIEAQQPPDEIPKWIDHGEADSGGGQRAEGPSGEAGKPNTPKTSKKAGIPGRSPSIQLTREELKVVAGTAGIIGLLKAASDANTPTSPYGGAQAAGNDPIAAIGNLLGTEFGTSGGFGGLDMLGTGHGGGGNATAAIGLGGLGTRGRGNGDGSGDGYGQGAGGYRNRNARVPRIRVEPPDLVGSLSKETIRRYIGRHIAEVRFCYESQMNTRPDLQGRVAIKFVISPSGAVMNAAVAQSDVGSARLEQCIADTVRRIDFPAPEGGGLVVVTYPFVLSQTGD